MKSLPEIVADNERAAEESVISALDRASAEYPSIELRTGNLLHIFKATYGSEPWEVWLNTEASDFDGLCVGTGHTRDRAVAAAAEVLETALEALHVPRRQGDDPLRPARDGEVSCGAQDGQHYICTRPVGHDGLHAAHGETDRVIASWRPEAAALAGHA